MARKAEAVGVTKAAMGFANTFVLAVLAGAFIAMGAVFATTTLAGTSGMPFGVARLLGGLAFTLGLILVVVARAELFTGNNLILMAWVGPEGHVSGAAAQLGDRVQATSSARSPRALTIAAAKVNLGFVQAMALGAFCNALVCLAVWLSYSARSVADKILAVIPPIAGGGLMVAALYWFVYLRGGREAPQHT
jgi:formate transporter